jgi:hypothetical protein
MIGVRRNPNQKKENKTMADKKKAAPKKSLKGSKKLGETKLMINPKP